MNRSLHRQRGTALVESALMIPVILTAALVVGDLFIVSRARADLERSTANLSAILANQSKLTASGVDQLVERTLVGRPDRYEIFVGQVWRNGTVSWALELGNTQGLCDNPLKNSSYQGPLPELDTTDDGKGAAMMVVQTCQESRALGLAALTLETEILRNIAIDRIGNPDMKLDAELRRRAGLADEEDKTASGG